MEDAEKNENQQNNGEVEDFGFHSSQIGQKPEPVYFVNVEERPITRLKKFIGAKRKILMISGASVVGVTVLVVLGIVFLPKLFKGSGQAEVLVEERRPKTEEEKISEELIKFMNGEYGGSYDLLKAEIERHLSKVKAEDPNGLKTIQMTMNLAKLEMTHGYNEEAAKILNAGAEEIKNNAGKIQFLTMLYEIYKKLGTKEEKVGVLERIVAIPSEGVELEQEDWAGILKPSYESELEELRKVE